MGFDETDQTIVNGGTPNDIKFPRGIRGYSLPNVEWKIQGNYGGNTDFPDKVRGILNEGGLCAEVRFLVLPSFLLTEPDVASVLAACRISPSWL